MDRSKYVHTSHKKIWGKPLNYNIYYFLSINFIVATYTIRLKKNFDILNYGVRFGYQKL